MLCTNTLTFTMYICINKGLVTDGSLYIGDLSFKLTIGYPVYFIYQKLNCLIEGDYHKRNP